MKKISLIILLTAALLSTLGCGLFSAVTNYFTEETEEVVLQPAFTEEAVAEEVVTEEVPIGDSVVVLFQDDFSDVNSGWDRNDWDNGFTDYVDGAYQIVVKTDNHDVWANPYRYFGGDVSVEVEVTKVAGELDDNYGILCRYSGEPASPSFYFFYISSDGYASIGKTIDGSSTLLSSDQMEYTDAINQGYATNYLQATCIGSELSFYINGVLVATATDSSLVDGDVGLDGGTFSAPTATFSFDNFVVTEP
ncbi:hypothetical protein JR338_08650 [Chloroflexota bacterium]|nr:hypothetical protein JR338_08650 [Chloroflexota bacterium]